MSGLGRGFSYGSGAYRLRRGLSIEAVLSHVGSYSKPIKLVGSLSWNPFWGLSWFLWMNIDKFFFASSQENPCRCRELKINSRSFSNIHNYKENSSV